MFFLSSQPLILGVRSSSFFFFFCLLSFKFPCSQVLLSSVKPFEALLPVVGVGGI